MKRPLWTAVSAFMGVALVLTIFAATRKVSGMKSGAEEARLLQETLRASGATFLAEEPPLRVFAMMPAEPDGDWRWKVEATLRPGRAPSDPEVSRALERWKGRCQGHRIRGKVPGGLLVVLHVAGGPDWSREWPR